MKGVCVVIPRELAKVGGQRQLQRLISLTLTLSGNMTRKRQALRSSLPLEQTWIPIGLSEVSTTWENKHNIVVHFWFTYWFLHSENLFALLSLLASKLFNTT